MSSKDASARSPSALGRGVPTRAGAAGRPGVKARRAEAAPNWMIRTRQGRELETGTTVNIRRSARPALSRASLAGVCGPVLEDA